MNVEQRLRRSGLLIAAGLAVEAVTLAWTHPLAFLVFMLVGGLLLAAGVVMFLLILLASSSNNQEAHPQQASTRES